MSYRLKGSVTGEYKKTIQLGGLLGIGDALGRLLFRVFFIWGLLMLYYLAKWGVIKIVFDHLALFVFGIPILFVLWQLRDKRISFNKVDTSGTRFEPLNAYEPGPEEVDQDDIEDILPPKFKTVNGWKK